MKAKEESTAEDVLKNNEDNDPQDGRHGGHGQDDAIDNESGDENEPRATKKTKTSESNNEAVNDSGSDDESWKEESEEEDDDDDDNDDEEEPETKATGDHSHATNQRQRLTWRMDPKESFSDWTVLIFKDDGTNQTYHVHRHALVIGIHRSEYFAGLFLNDTYQEHNTKTGEIHLQDLAVETFPLFLDFLYNVDTIDMDEHLVALYHLAGSFQVEALTKRIEQAILPQVCLQNDFACRIYSDAISFEPPVQALVDRVENLCISPILEIQPSSPILNILRPESFLAILADESHLRVAECGLETPSNVSRHLSKLVVAYCRLHDIDADTFDHLIRDYVLPAISLDAAQNLIALQEAIIGATPSKMSASLEQRCCAAILEEWDKIDL